MPENKIFISHASKDEPLVTPFVDKILNIGLEISRDKIFYTSAKDTGIRSGEDFKKTIKEQILSATAVIQIITQNYKQSEICLNEMGAAWVLCDNVIPFILEPVNFESVGFLHNTTQLLKLNNESDLFQFHDDHPELYDNRRIKTSNYHKQVKEYIAFISNGRYRLGSFGY
ncbi:toll/interleukin-1 receptor domain-containing protein [Mucilaginibacter sp. UR6-11]|uniref:toll/interleukin-1 receptor domain-containing protein n=1 Tax=Mucilaginibacter sp. UR6-11 TaxID=1435644 RepID=UPI001E3F65C8|nr:toll/interleukin-1 receptor domain-containing protein [Mucilaginibacter sp. UR6-11]MCC8426917.1 toll/interleukin-1 receptor domain-containing protein [Mucilaginibacter sp. UR6-11]